MTISMAMDLSLHFLSLVVGFPLQSIHIKGGAGGLVVSSFCFNIHPYFCIPHIFDSFLCSHRRTPSFTYRGRDGYHFDIQGLA